LAGRIGADGRLAGSAACIWNPHCWQNAKPSGVWVPQRGHATVAWDCARGIGAAGGGIAAIGAGIGGSIVGSLPMPWPYAGGAGKPPIGPDGAPSIGPAIAGGSGSGPGGGIALANAGAPPA
jgi:hypothetical protein